MHNYIDKTNVKTLGIDHGYEVDENEIWMGKVYEIKAASKFGEAEIYLMLAKS